MYVYVDESVQLMLIKAPWGVYYYDSHLTDEKTEAQESQASQRPKADLCGSRHSDVKAPWLCTTQHDTSSPEWTRNPRVSPPRIHRRSKSSGKHSLIKALG